MVVLHQIRLLVGLLLLVLAFSVEAQPYSFELLIPWDDGDTSIMGIKSQELSDGSFIIMSNNQAYDASPGIPFEGQLTLGTGLVKLSREGEFLWKKHYETNFMFPALEANGRTPAVDFCTNDEDEIILPYSIFVGNLPCDSNLFLVSSFKKSLLKTDKDGLVSNMNTFPSDMLCDQDQIISIDQVGTNYKLLYQENEKDKVYLETLNSIFEVIDTSIVEADGRWFFYDPFEDQILSITQSGISFLTPDGELIDDIVIDQPNLQAPSLKLEINEQYIAAVYHGFSNNPERASNFVLIDKMNDQVQQAYFEDQVLIDVAITANQELLVVSDNSLFNFYDTLLKPVKVTLFNSNLEQITEHDAGFPFVLPSSIEITSDNGYTVTGTRLKSIDLVNGKAPDQVYFLKGTIDELVNVSTPASIKEVPLLIYPNPTQESIHLVVKDEHSLVNGYWVEIYNSFGKKMKKSSLIQLKTSSISLQQLPAGIYFIRVLTKNGRIVFIEKVAKN